MKTMATVALLFSLFVMFIPLVGDFLTLISGGLAVFVRGPGFGLALAALIVNLFNLFLFSPLKWSNALGGLQRGDYLWMAMLVFLVVFQIGAVFILYRANRALKKRLPGTR